MPIHSSVTRRFFRYKVAAMLLGVLCISPAARAQPIPNLPTTLGNLRAKAPSDECYFALGGNLPFTSPPCFFSREKVNQAYLWAMTLDPSGEKIVFGTAANPHCLAQGVFGLITPYETDSWSCEFGSSPYAFLLDQIGPGLDLLGDYRPPKILVYDRGTQTVTDITPKNPSGLFGVTTDVLLTRGMRFAVTIDNVILIGGPTLLGDVNLFAFRADTLEFLGVGTLAGMSHIRQGVIVDGALYLAVGFPAGGAIVRWTGRLEPAPCGTCFSFEVVGQVDGVGAFIAEHEGRLFVSTWPTGAVGVLGALYMSPPIPDGGLTPAHMGEWTRVWDAEDYEPDQATAASYSAGALASFKGFLYWGTMHVPHSALLVFLGLNGIPDTEQGILEAITGTFRASALFRGRDFGTPGQDIRLLYGSRELPAFTPPENGNPGHWELRENNMPPGKKDPLFGFAGINNPWNNYTWTMSVWDGRLWVGTMDSSHSFRDGAVVLADAVGPPFSDAVNAFFALFTPGFGADLHFFPSAATPALPESINGVGNYTNWGVRTMLDGGNLFLGMANPANLLTNRLDLLPEGGWELIELGPKPVNTPVGSHVHVSPGDGVEIEFCDVSAAGTTFATTIPNFFDLLLETPPEPGFDEPDWFSVTFSSADWQHSCPVPELARVCVPLSGGELNPELRQLQLVEGELRWVLLASEVAGESLCGEERAGSLGLFAPFSRNCDINGDTVVDRRDIDAIRIRRNTRAGPSEPRDVDGDGLVSVRDMRVCTLRCTYERCALGTPLPASLKPGAELGRFRRNKFDRY